MPNLPYTSYTYDLGTTTSASAHTQDEGPEQGWQCPKCKRIYAPWKEECSHCVGNSTPTLTVTPPSPYPLYQSYPWGHIPLHVGDIPYSVPVWSAW